MNSNLAAAAFIIEGLHLSDYQAVLDSQAFDTVLDLMEEITSYAPYIERLADGAYAYLDQQNIGAPGVFPYEVTSPFGEWWGRYVIENTTAPNTTTANTHLVQSVFNFCMTAKLTNDQQLKLSEILNGVPRTTTFNTVVRMPTNTKREIIPPPSGWKAQTYYVVDVAYASNNPIHRAILYVGFIAPRDALSGGYTCILNAKYDSPASPACEAWYLRPISVIEDLSCSH